MSTHRVNGKPDPQPLYCPHCKQALNLGRALLLAGMITGMAYICHPCKTIFLPDLKPLARKDGKDRGPRSYTFRASALNHLLDAFGAKALGEVT